ncbi:hypothetical protein [Haloferula sp. BvORR071]|uniref:hypothetical protein n=1 Tax=Haloferula sp. BvORR071 TaxID=1396141 RepID=UPI00054D1443|nr:hypothetical protein [Haloferula sp. BvORR071]
MMAALKARTYDPYKDLWATWTNAEIRAALDQSLVHPECLTTTGSGMGVVNSLLKELLKRDTDAAVAWFDSIAFEGAKKRFVYTIPSAWPEERAAAGLDFLLGHRSLFPGSVGWSILAKNIQASATQGPAGVEGMLTRLKQEGFSLDFENSLRFPEGFDFKGLFEGQVWQGLDEGGVRESAVRAFRQQDPEGAFAWLLEKQGVAGLGLSEWYGYEDPGSERLAWLGKRIEALDATQQSEYFEKTQAEWVRMPDAAVTSFAKEVRSPAMQELLRKAVVQQIYAGNTRGSLAALEALGEPAERLRALEEATPGELFASGHRPMSPADEAFIRSKLTAWNADAARIQSIVDQLKK